MAVPLASCSALPCFKGREFMTLLGGAHLRAKTKSGGSMFSLERAYRPNAARDIIGIVA